jgi:hypothetical protein
MVGEAGKVLEQVRALINTLKDPQAFAQGKANVIASMNKLAAAGLGKINDPEALGLSVPEGSTVYASDVFPGNRIVWAAVPTSPDNIGSYRCGVHIVPQEIPDNAQARVLSPNDIAALGKIAVEFSTAIEPGLEAAKRVSEIAKNLARINTGEVEDAVVSSYLRSLRAVVHVAKGLHQPAIAVGSAVVNSGMDYAALSVKAYAAKPAEAAPAAAPAAA